MSEEGFILGNGFNEYFSSLKITFVYDFLNSSKLLFTLHTFKTHARVVSSFDKPRLLIKKKKKKLLYMTDRL